MNSQYIRKPKNTKRPMSGWWIAVIDIVLIGVCLVVFSLFHHVLPTKPGDTGPIVTISRPTATPKPNDTSTTDPSTTPTDTVDHGMFGEKFADKFSDTVINTETEYRSKDISITIERVTRGDAVYFVADIYIRNIDNFKTGFGQDQFGQGYYENMIDMSNRVNALVALSGDMSNSRRGGIVIRNGEIYQTKEFRDVCVLYYDGTMRTFGQHDFDVNQAVADGAYQAWDFGPRLLGDNGEVLTTFNSDVNKANPRSAIGYYEPGHYCFVLIDGRGMNGSSGMTTAEMSQLFNDMGCKAAFNLDGGQSAMMVRNGKFVNDPYKGGRSMTDILYIGEVN